MPALRHHLCNGRSAPTRGKGSMREDGGVKTSPLTDRVHRPEVRGPQGRMPGLRDARKPDSILCPWLPLLLNQEMARPSFCENFKDQLNIFSAGLFVTIREEENEKMKKIICNKNRC